MLPGCLNLHKLLLPVLALTVLAGCAGMESREGDDPDSAPATVPEPSPSAAFDTLDEALEGLEAEPVVMGPHPPPDLWERLTPRFAFAECADGSRAARWARWYADRPEYMQRVFNRARPWLHDIANEVERRDLPGELALLPIVESAFDPFAYSHGRAAGSWQFLSGTAQDFGLEINDWYDGRRDVYAATRAALDYLEYLAGLFDRDWELVLAAYNAGQGRVRRAINRNARLGRSTRWADLPLPAETRGYVPKLQGLSCIFRDPATWSFERPRVADQPRFTRVELPGPTDVVVAADLADLEIAELIGLNPGLNRHMTPPSGPHHLIVPVNRAERLETALDDLAPDERIRFQEVRVRRGDTLSHIARRHHTSVAEIRRHNGLNGDMLRAGHRLQIPSANGAAAADDRLAADYRKLTELQQRLLPTDRFRHRVRPGESLWAISRRYGVPVAEIQRRNGLGGTMIHPGQQLVIETGRPAPGTGAPGPIEYTVRRGDSLWTIARRHQVALADLMRWNGLEPDSILRPGQKLTIHRGDA